jgi:hypothetical protein
VSLPESTDTATAIKALYEHGDRLRDAIAALKKTGSHAGAVAAIGLTEVEFEVFLVNCACLYGLRARVDEYDDARAVVEQKRATDRAEKIVAELKEDGRLFSLVKDAFDLHTWVETVINCRR